MVFKIGKLSWSKAKLQHSQCSEAWVKKGLSSNWLFSLTAEGRESSGQILIAEVNKVGSVLEVLWTISSCDLGAHVPSENVRFKTPGSDD